MFRKMRLAMGLILVICVAMWTSNYQPIEAETTSPYDWSD